MTQQESDVKPTQKSLKNIQKIQKRLNLLELVAAVMHSRQLVLGRLLKLEADKRMLETDVEFQKLKGIKHLILFDCSSLHQ